MSRVQSLRLLSLVLALSLALLGCGIPLDNEPEVIAGEALPQSLQPGSSTTTTLPSLLTQDVTIYLINPGDGEASLVPVERQVPVVSEGDEQIEVLILEQLLLGPTSEEQLEDNLTTAVVSSGDDPIEVLGLRRPVEGQIVVVLSEPPALEGSDQVVSFAQLVYTLTEINTVDRVRFLVINEAGEEEDISVKTDTEEGDVRRPVGRDDYMSLSPLRSPS
ncbi:MAG: GerMN domain-containing protein [Acidimicrobiia bacterium]|nr:GerMN domain-containing protein [Acidimicrobiia bacterium]